MCTHQNDQFKTKKLVLFASIWKRTKKIEKSVDIFSVPWLRLLKYTIYLRCLKIHCNFRFRFQWTHRGSDKSTPLSYDSAGGHHEVVFSLYFSSGSYLPRSNGKQYNDAFFSLLTILILEHTICGKRDPVTQFLFFRKKWGEDCFHPRGLRYNFWANKNP